MTRFNRRLFLQGSAAVIAAPSIVRAQGNQPIRIGVIQTLSGPAGEPGRDQVIGCRLAVEDFNRAGGWKGRNAELVVRDDKFNANESVAAVRELSGDGVNLIFGPLFSGLALACLPVLKPSNVAFLISGPALMSLTHDQYVPNLFRVCSNAYMAYRAEAKVLAQRYPDVLKWSAIVADTQATRDIYKTFANGIKTYYPQLHKKQAELLEPIVVKAGTTDFRNHIGSILASGAEGLLVDVFAGDALTFLQQARPFGFFDKVKAIGDISLNVNMGRTLKKNTPKDVWSVMTWQELGYNDVPKAKAFIKSTQEMTKDPTVNQYHAQAHVSIDMLLQAVKKADSTETAAVIAALESTTFDTIYGPLGFRKEDHQVLMNPGVVRMNPADTEQGWTVSEFVKVPWQEAIEPPGPGTPFVEN